MKINKLTIEIEPQDLSTVLSSLSSFLDAEVKGYDTFESFREDYESELQLLQLGKDFGQYWGDLVPSGEELEGEMTYEYKEFNNVLARYNHIHRVWQQ